MSMDKYSYLTTATGPPNMNNSDSTNTADQKNTNNSQNQAVIRKCPKCGQKSTVVELKQLPNGGHLMHAEHLDKSTQQEDHTWDEYDFDLPTGLEQDREEEQEKIAMTKVLPTAHSQTAINIVNSKEPPLAVVAHKKSKGSYNKKTRSHAKGWHRRKVINVICPECGREATSGGPFKSSKSTVTVHHTAKQMPDGRQAYHKMKIEEWIRQTGESILPLSSQKQLAKQNNNIAKQNNNIAKQKAGPKLRRKKEISTYNKQNQSILEKDKIIEQLQKENQELRYFINELRDKLVLKSAKLTKRHRQYK